MTAHRLGSRTTKEVAGRGLVLLVPLGSTEQHGPHLPLDTDSRIAVAWADGLAARVDDAVVAPPLAYGSSGEHQSFAGTVSIGQEALRRALVELVRSAAHSFRAVILVNGHGGNAEPVTAAVDQLSAEGHQIRSLSPRWPGDDHRFPLIDAHAGRVETSLMLHLAPEAVRLDQAEAGSTAPLHELMPRLRLGGVTAVSANGVLGDPTGANAAEGELLLDHLVEASFSALVAEGFVQPRALGRPAPDC